jgi:hypothetical protein
MISPAVPLPSPAPNFDRSHMTTTKPGNCEACGNSLPIPRSIAMHFCPSCSADPARTIKAETGRYPRRSDTLRSGVKVDRLVQDFKKHGSIRRICRDYDLSRPYVTKLLRRKGCATDQRVLKAATKRKRIIEAFRKHPSMKGVCKLTRSSARYVREVLQEAGFETPKVQRKIADWKRIIDLYDSGLSTRAIAEQFGVGDETIRRGILRRGGVMRPKMAWLPGWHAEQRGFRDRARRPKCWDKLDPLKQALWLILREHPEAKGAALGKLLDLALIECPHGALQSHWETVLGDKNAKGFGAANSQISRIRNLE